MKIYSGAGLGDFYYQLVRDVTEYDRKIKTDDGDCIELPFPVVFEYEKPGYCWMRIPNRKFNPFFALAEVIWILSGNGNVRWISHFNKNIARFADEGSEDFHGAYGKRIRHWPGSLYSGMSIDQLSMAVDKLKKDQYSRRAVISLWDVEADNLMKSNDYPCNNMVYYTFRDGILDQTVVIRSNDLIWGTPYNAVQFTHLHALVAGMLGAKMGKFVYFVQNLHYYMDLYKTTLSHVLECAFEKETLGAECAPSFDTVTMEGFEIAEQAVNGILKPTNGVDCLGVGTGYWGHTIPKMILIHELHRKQNKTALIEDLVSSLGQPFADLVFTFYDKESK